MRGPFTTELTEDLTQLISLYCLCALCGLNSSACGRKGPPLPPLVHVPAVVGQFTAKRLGGDVVLQFTIPSANTDNSRPAELDRVEVYAHTGPLPAPADFLRYGTLMGTIPVKAPLAGRGGMLPGLDQGERTGVKETIAPAHMEIGPMPVVRRNAIVPVPPVLETPGTVNIPPPLMRYYVAVGAGRGNRRGAFSAPLGVPLVSPPPAPGGLQAHYAQEAMMFEWVPSPATQAEGIVAPFLSYNIYEAAEEPKAPVNVALLAQPAFTRPSVEFGTRRCYVVRAVKIVVAVPIESDPSAELCLTPVDTFPPAAPKGLGAVASENVVSLIWEPNTDKDLNGYLVLRGEAPGDKLAPLTTEPVHDTTYRDTTVKAGVSYVYAVEAIDTATPPNVSEYSNRAQADVR